MFASAECDGAARIVGVTGVVAWIVERVVGRAVVECAGGSTFSDAAGAATSVSRAEPNTHSKQSTQSERSAHAERRTLAVR